MENKILKSSNGTRIPLYEKIGQFFKPNGTFDENMFSRTINSKLKELEEESESHKVFTKSANKWLSLYLVDVIEYLQEKGMPKAALKIIHTASQSCIRFNIESVKISPKLLKNMSSIINEAAEQQSSTKETKDEKRKKIFQAALSIFAEEGYHNATIDKIAHLSGIAKGSVYRYFKSKEDLLHQLLEEHYEDIVGRISDIFSFERDIVEQVEEFIEFWLRYIEENTVVYRLIQAEAIGQHSYKGTMLYDYIISHLPLFKERIVALNKDNKLKTTSFYSVFYGILGFIDGIVHKWMRAGKSYSLIEEKSVIFEVLFNGFVGEKQTKKRYVPQPTDIKND